MTLSEMKNTFCKLEHTNILNTWYYSLHGTWQTSGKWILNCQVKVRENISVFFFYSARFALSFNMANVPIFIGSASAERKVQQTEGVQVWCDQVFIGASNQKWPVALMTGVALSNLEYFVFNPIFWLKQRLHKNNHQAKSGLLPEVSAAAVSFQAHRGQPVFRVIVSSLSCIHELLIWHHTDIITVVPFLN